MVRHLPAWDVGGYDRINLRDEHNVRAHCETVVASARCVPGLRKNACVGMQKFVPHGLVSKLVVFVGTKDGPQLSLRVCARRYPVIRLYPGAIPTA
jgi:hypothetical protein